MESPSVEPSDCLLLDVAEITLDLFVADEKVGITLFLDVVVTGGKMRSLVAI